MKNNSSANVSLWSNFVRKMKKFLKLFLKSTRKNQFIIERIQLTFIYFFATVVLSYSIQGYLGGFPEFVFQLFPFLQDVLSNPILKLLATPEKTFVIYLVVLELLMNRSRFGFSLLVKFNILLIFILEMFQNLMVSYWDLFFNREIEYNYVGGEPIFDQELAIFFFIVLYFFFLMTYFYCYTKSLNGRFPVFPGTASFVTDSVAFWLQIKIPKKKGKK
jgi:hypothetical protein